MSSKEIAVLMFKIGLSVNRSDALTLETSAFNFFTVADLP